MFGKTELTVRGYHLDMFGHVNNARYLEFLEEARWNALESSELTPTMLFERGRGLAVVNININYKYPAAYGDVLEIETNLKRIGSKSITLSQNIYLKENRALVVDAEVIFVVIDATSGSALELDSEMKKRWFNIEN